MRASRLLSILTLLQARGRVTATELASACEVSLRTVYRDMEALGEAGIPVYSERGCDGGYRLIDGYRTQLNGFSKQEADALFLGNLTGPAEDLGLGPVLTTAKNKLLSALPVALRRDAETSSGRFHLDAPPWFSSPARPQYLAEVASAVWAQRRISIQYKSWKAIKERVVAPLGLVLKGGAWYLVGQVDEDVRTYRISRILEMVVLEDRFTCPPDFDLQAYWNKATRRLEADLYGNVATVRLSPLAVRLIEEGDFPVISSATRIERRPDADGWRLALVPVGSIQQACMELLRFGAEVEILEPAELRTKLIEIVDQMTAVYSATNRQW